MQNHWYCLVAGLFFFLPLPAQTTLREGTVHYRMATSSTQIASLSLHFTYDLAALSVTSDDDPGSGTFQVLNYQSGESQGFLYAHGDTTATAVTPLYYDEPQEKRYDLKIPAKEKKTILGYSCTYFELRPKDSKKAADRITGWTTDRIRTRARPVASLNYQLPGFPLELTLREGSSGAIITYRADEIGPLDTALLGAYRDYMRSLLLTKPDAILQAERSFNLDTTIRLEIVVPSGWSVVENSYRTVYLINERLKSIFRLDRKVPLRRNNQEIPLEKSVLRQSAYLQDVLHLPAPALERFTFRDQPAVQRTWHYPNARNYIFHTFPKGQNPYDFFPLSNLVEVQRAFLMQDVLYELQLVTVEENFEPVLHSIQHILDGASLIMQ